MNVRAIRDWSVRRPGRAARRDAVARRRGAPQRAILPAAELPRRPLRRRRLRFLRRLHRLPAADQPARRRRQRREADLVRVRDRVRRRARRRVLRAPEEGAQRRARGGDQPAAASASPTRRSIGRPPTRSRSSPSTTVGPIRPTAASSRTSSRCSSTPTARSRRSSPGSARRPGGIDKLKGKKIVTLYHGSPYGKETIPILDLYAKKYGFQITHIEVPHPGNEQQSQWLTIRRNKPDWVILRGWGVMNPVAIKTAAKTGFPVDHIIGNIWSNAEEDVRPAGAVGKGYIAITTGPSGTNFPVLQDIDKNVVKPGKGDLKDPKRFGTIYYNLGVENGILNVEAVRTAQAKFGKRPLTGEEVRWGFENLQHRRAPPEGAGRAGAAAADQALVLGPRRGRRGALPAVGRQQVGDDQRLGPSRPRRAAPDHRGLGGEVRQGEGDQAARLRPRGARLALSADHGRGRD